MGKRRLPIGVQTFRTLRETDCYYVDKTTYIKRLLDEGSHYFLSRPRRFGKSLFLDTLKELFEGNEALFEGLCIHRRWNWTVCHPVLRPQRRSRTLPAPFPLRSPHCCNAERSPGLEVAIHWNSARVPFRSHPAQAGLRSISCRAMMIRWSSFVPSPIASNGASR